MENKKIIIFDMDGVLFNSVDLMNNLTLSEFPGMTLQEAKDLHKGNIFEELEKLKHKRKKETEKEIKERREIYTKNKLKAPMYSGMKNLLIKLSKKYNLVINSSAKTVNCKPLLDRENIIKCFSFIATKEVHKRKVEKFKIIAEKFNQNIEDMLFVTDTIGDLREASEVGLPTIAVTWGMHDNEYFKKEKHDNLVAVAGGVEELDRFIRDFN